MARKTWVIEIWNGSAWISDGFIYRPNSNTEIATISTQTKVNLTDGGKGFVTPEVVYENVDIGMQFLEIFPTDAFYTKILDYVQNQSYLRITTHLGDIWIGKFIVAKRVWIAGMDDTFDIEVMFQRMEIIP